MMTLFSQEEVMESCLADSRRESEFLTMTRNLKSIMQKKNFTLEEAMDLLDIPVADRARYAEQL